MNDGFNLKEMIRIIRRDLFILECQVVKTPTWICFLICLTQIIFWKNLKKLMLSIN